VDDYRRAASSNSTIAMISCSFPAHSTVTASQSPTTLPQLSSGAISGVKDFILPNQVATFYQEALKYIETGGPHFARPGAQARAETSVAPLLADGA
jgi:hypothetical protein